MIDRSKLRDIAIPGAPKARRAAGIGRRRLSLLAGVLLTVAPLASLADTTVSASIYAVPGNGPYGQPSPAAYPTAPGSYQVGPASGTMGGNSATGQLAIQAFPQPALSATVVGSSNGADTNTAYAQVDASLTFDFYVQGPQSGVSVPVLIAGSSFGSFANAGDPTGWNNQVGTRIKFVAPDASTAATLHLVGPQAGTAPDVYLGFQVPISFASWSNLAPGPVPYTQYTSTFLLGATVQSSTTKPPAGLESLGLFLHAIGGDNAGGQPLSGRKTYSLGSTSAALSEAMYIDPNWAATHPGYTLIIDAGVGNVPAVPEPSRTVLTLAGLIAMAWIARNLGCRDHARTGTPRAAFTDGLRSATEDRAQGRALRGAMALGLLVVSSSLCAAPVVVGSLDAVTGVTGLVVNGVSYDANFVHAGQTYQDLFASTAPTFLGDPSGAQSASVALAGALAAAGVYGVAGLAPPTPKVEYVFLLGIPYDLVPNAFFQGGFEVDSAVDQYDSHHGIPWDGSSRFALLGSAQTPDATTTLVTFRREVATELPEPGMTALLAGGLGCLCLSQRKRVAPPRQGKRQIE